jgi:hypothetical protein
MTKSASQNNVQHDQNDVNEQDTVARKIPISMHQLQERLDNIRGAVMMCK